MFVRQAADELFVKEETVKRDLGRVLACESAAEEAVRAATEAEDTTVHLSAEEEAAALELLKDPRLVERILADFEMAGVVGEQTNKLLGYLAAVSRKLEDPLAVMVRSSSAAGKSSLLDAVLAFVPEEDRVAYSAMTGQSLFYMGERDLAHKVLAIAEEEGAARAAYALKLLQSEGELSIASTGKDPASGRLTTHTYRVAGPVAILTTTTAAEVDEELLNRCIVLTVDENRAQTRAIHDRQRAAQTIDGLLARRGRDAVVKVHRDAQRLLKPVLVANPFAPRLGFADERTRTRRDHVKYLSLIRAIALLHQHQRPPPHGCARRPGGRLHRGHGRRRRPRQPARRRGAGPVPRRAGPPDAPAARGPRHHGRRRRPRPPHGAGRGALLPPGRPGALGVGRHPAQGPPGPPRRAGAGGGAQGRPRPVLVYELAWDGSGRDGRPFLTGLIDPAALVADGSYDAKRSGSNGSRSGAGRAVVGGRSGPGRSIGNEANGQASGHAASNSGGESEEPTSADDTAPVVIGEQSPAAARAS
ncbi:MAG: hypothetical protein ACRD0M_04225 [Acidimicrobiales bacterium]